MVEHNNNQIKDLLRNQGPNVTFDSAQKASASVKGVADILHNFDEILHIHPESGRSATVNKKQDIKAIVDVLAKYAVFSLQAGRQHNTCKGQDKDPISSLNREDLMSWITQHQKKLHLVYEKLRQ